MLESIIDKLELGLENLKYRIACLEEAESFGRVLHKLRFEKHYAEEELKDLKQELKEIKQEQLFSKHLKKGE